MKKRKEERDIKRKKRYWKVEKERKGEDEGKDV